MSKVKKVSSPYPAPPIPRLPRFLSLGKQMVKSLVAPSVTQQQIADYWRQRRMIEEDHLSAAIKAAARIRAQKLSENDYLQFEASLEDDENMENENKNKNNAKASSKKDENEEIRVGTKDWWTKSTYAYLNEPVMISVVKTPRKTPCSSSPRLLGHLTHHGYQVS